MDNAFDLLPLKEMIKPCTIPDIRPIETRLWMDCLLKACRQIICDYNISSGAYQFTNQMGANITGSSEHKDRHSFRPFFRIDSDPSISPEQISRVYLVFHRIQNRVVSVRNNRIT